GEATQTFDLRVITPGYFATMLQPILSGRAFTMRDEDGPATVIINETMAHHRFPNESAVGKRIRFDDGMGWGPWAEIVGVTGDVTEYGLNRKPVDEVYAVIRNGFLNRLIVRTKLDSQGMEKGVRAAIREIHPMIAIDRVETVENAE